MVQGRFTCALYEFFDQGSSIIIFLTIFNYYNIQKALKQMQPTLENNLSKIINRKPTGCILSHLSPEDLCHHRKLETTCLSVSLLQLLNQSTAEILLLKTETTMYHQEKCKNNIVILNDLV